MYGVYLSLFGDYGNFFCVYCKEGELNFKDIKWIIIVGGLWIISFGFIIFMFNGGECLC